MKIVNIIPISRNIRADSLTYFSATAVPIAALVVAPFRSKKIIGLVESVAEAGGLKTEIKKSGFALKKIIRLANSQLLLPQFIKAAEKLADYFGQPKSSVLASLIPQTIIKNLISARADINLGQPRSINSPTDYPKPKILQAADQERLAVYKSLMRESFAQGKSVALIGPTGPELEEIFTNLSRGVKNHCFLLSGRLTEKKMLQLWSEIVSRTHPVLIAATPIFLSLPRPDLGTIIFENEAGHSKQMVRPFLDFRTLAEFLCQETGWQLILADRILSLETLNKYQTGHYQELLPLARRSFLEIKSRVVDMRSYDKLKEADKELPIFSDELKNLLATTASQGRRLLAIINRKGLYPTTVCRDCGDILFCQHCASPLVLHLLKGQRLFICHKCQNSTEPTVRCRNCGSWNLRTLGVGLELVAQKLSSLVPAKKIFRLDKDSAKTQTAALGLIRKFLETPGAVMVATEMATLYLKEPVDFVAVISLDNLLTIPDFNIGEKIFRLLMKLKNLASQEFLIQTRYPDYPSISQAARGSLTEFARLETAERKRFDYPPFSRLIKITRQGEEKKVMEDLNQLAGQISQFRPIIIPAFTARIKNNYRAHLILKVDKDNWPEPRLVKLLKSLPPKFIIDVEPNNLL